MRTSDMGRICATVKWNKPLCSDCREPIDDIDDAVAAWLMDEDGGGHEPEIIHSGGKCGHLRRDRVRQRANERGCPHRLLADISVTDFRRAPMDVVIIAMRGTERERWTRWVSIVLGLPYNRWNCIGVLRVNREVADYVPMAVNDT